MLEEILRHIHNWFVTPNGVHRGTFSVENGTMDLPFVAPAQYFRIVGSVFNDGLHQGPPENLVDETFTGEVWALAIPGAVLALSTEVEEWCQSNPDTRYVSESFGGYSRTLGVGQNTGVPITWREAFRGRLNAWRKL